MDKSQNPKKNVAVTQRRPSLLKKKDMKTVVYPKYQWDGINRKALWQRGVEPTLCSSCGVDLLVPGYLCEECLPDNICVDCGIELPEQVMSKCNICIAYEMEVVSMEQTSMSYQV